MLPRNHPDRIHVAFDDHRLVANAGLLLPVTLAHRSRSGCNWLTATLTWGMPRVGAQCGRQDTDPGGIGAGRGRLHRRCRRAALWRNRTSAGTVR